MRLPPDAPSVVQIIQEGDHFVMRTLLGERPLYTFDHDEPGQSNCTGSCATTWPPLVAGPHEKPVNQWSVVERPDGNYQWAFGGKPVYTRAQDTQGHAKGDDLRGVWHLLPTIPGK
jgi:predicted lipoprotein with Yx(FWY)xxD motif